MNLIKPTNQLNNAMPSILALMVGVGVYFFLVGSTSFPLFNDPDTWMHIAAGRWIYEHQFAPLNDPFSIYFAGQPWVDHEWLAQLLMYLVDQSQGLFGLRVLSAVLFAMTLVILFKFLLARVPPIYALLFVFISYFGLVGHLLVRPHLFTWPIMAFWFCKLFATTENHPSRPPYALCLLMALWANLHGSFILGLAFLPLFAIEAISQEGQAGCKKIALRWTGFTVLCLVFSFITPYGFDGIKLGANLVSSEYIARIKEWSPSVGAELLVVELCCAGVLMLAIFGNLKLSVARTIMFLGLAYEAIGHARYVSIFGLLMPLIFAKPFGCLCEARASAFPPGRLDSYFCKLSGFIRPIPFISIILVCLGLTMFFQRYDSTRVPSFVMPQAAIDAVESNKVHGRVFNYANFGAYLIYRGIPVFVDGRADLYGNAYLQDYFECASVQNPQKTRECLDRNYIAWTIFPPEEPINLLLSNSSSWKKIYEDKQAIIYIRT
ncbi:hypothetical protein [Polynucleobacter sp. UB-Tiil-W10]|uniref:hypothetical protein n=1 Tax=Polynucleobacter sp. UB-Tiil-W10 TaxID=1855648 RepID=UPI001C0B2364|nr:hypothetical protein [Polynucleobacter sp. UB-Tiil-W10]MBU3541641.1 hypothetical protein [Polynucleobacter sp. UB-Tiil-W10]